MYYDNPIVSIGLPVYNGEKFIRKRLESILSQTLQNFELIISDNASTDSTSYICKEYSDKDKRIRFIRQKKNKGGVWNFDFVLQEARCEYFVWASVDDIWVPNFLEKNVRILESNKNIVGSIGDVELYTSKDRKIIQDQENYKSDNFMKFQYVHSVSGSYEEKVKFYLKFCQSSIIYGVYRTKELQKSIIHEKFHAWDLAVILNVIRYGDLYVIDEVLVKRFDRFPSTSLIHLLLNQKVGILKIIFPAISFTSWCIKNLGIKIFVKNIMKFIRLNIRAEYSIALELIRICKRIIFRQEKFW